MTPLARRLVLTATLAAALAVTAPAQAAPPWIFRSITLPRGHVALDLGFGYGHAPIGNTDRSYGGTGMNFEFAAGVSPDLEIGVRTGFRFDSDGQVTQADRYGRTFDTETYGTRGDRVANPELHMRWAVARGSNAQLGLEVRAYLPVETQSRFGLMFGLPIALRAGAVRIDTGLYVPVVFYDPTWSAISVPIHVWIQASSSLWLGPLFGLRVVNNGGNSYNEYPLGFGLGTMLSHAIDLRTWFLFPHINGDQAARTFGLGVALQIRFE
jgi:opacity protein-like surface antigen